MASIRFAAVAYNHFSGAWSAAKVDTYSGPPRNYVTQDEGEAIVALGGQITPGFYDTQHAAGVAGAAMVGPDPDWQDPASVAALAASPE